jgi:hypothetical protein
MPQVGFELTISVFERAKTVHDLDRSATVTDFFCVSITNFNMTLLYAFPVPFSSHVSSQNMDAFGFIIECFLFIIT